MTPVAALLLGLLAADLAASGAVTGPPPPSQAAVPAAVLVLEVLIDAGLTDRHLDASLVENLRAELAASHVVVTAAGTRAATPTNARLTVGPVSGNPHAVSLEIQYLPSGAAVHRTLELSSLPTDGALLAIAVAVDELIRASWSLGGVSPSPPRSPPPAPATAIAPVAARAEVRLLMSGERHDGGVFTLGPDLELAALLGPRFSVAFRAGWRHAGARTSADGSIDSSAITGGVGASFALPARTSDSRAGAALVARLDGAWISAHGTPASGATGYSTTALGAAAVGGLDGWLTLVQPMRLVAFAGWAIPLRSVTATDGSQSAGMVFHPGFSAATGIGARF